MNTYKFSVETTKPGQTIYVRPIVNAKNLKANTLQHKFMFGIQGWSYKYMFMAFIYDDVYDGELKAFYCGEKIQRLLRKLNKDIIEKTSDKKGFFPLISPMSDYAIKIIVKEPVKVGENSLFDFDCSIVQEDRFCYGKTEEDKIKFKNILETSEINLELEFAKAKDKIKDIVIKMPQFETIETVKEIRLGDIFENEKS